MANWDEDSPRLRKNLSQVLRAIRDSALRREVLTLAAARQWQYDTMAGLNSPKPTFVGRFRGERGIKQIRVWIGGGEGAPPAAVDKQLKVFEGRLQRTVAALDERYPVGQEPDADGIAAVIDLCAWAHSEWVRIHPFANGNGRTARLWANALFMRYGMPPVIRLRPRPDGGYAAAGARAMSGDWTPTAAVFRKMLIDFASADASGDREK